MSFGIGCNLEDEGWRRRMLQFSMAKELDAGAKPRAARKGLRGFSLAILLVGAMLTGMWPFEKVSGQILSSEELEAKIASTFGAPPQMKLLDEKGRVWIDPKNHRVVVDGYIAVRKGQLEMFACLQGTKEHESVVAVLCKAATVHAALLAVGAKPGAPTKFEPYVPATGSTIQVHVLYRQSDGSKKIVDARSMIQHAATGKTMTYDWVFAGSGFYKDPETGTESYLAEGGDLICVANFPSATMDLAVRSADSNSGLVFMANTEAIPEQGTPVRLVLEVVDRPPAGLGQSLEPAKGLPTKAAEGPGNAADLQQASPGSVQGKETSAASQAGEGTSQADSKRSPSPAVASPPSSQSTSGDSQGGKGG
jgi:hypothetical protein